MFKKNLEDRIVNFHDVVKVDNPIAAIKFYTMQNLSNFRKEEIDTMKGTIKEMIEKRKIERRSGMGFAIASEGVLNISLWGTAEVGEKPNVIYPTILTFDKRELIIPDSFAHDSVNDVGAYCIYELAIVQHEAKAWRKFLVSQHKKPSVLNETRYSYNFFQGIIPGC